MPRSPAVWTKSVQNVCRKFWKVTRRWRPASATRGRSTLRVKLDFARIGPPVVVVKTNGDNAGPRAVLLHPVAVGAELPDDLAREVHQADLVLLRPIDEPPFAELPLNAYSAILKVEVDPLQPKAFAQPEAGPQPLEEHLEVLTPNRRHCDGSEHGEGVLPKRPLIVELGEGVDCLECQPLDEVLADRFLKARREARPAVEEREIVGRQAFPNDGGCAFCRLPVAADIFPQVPLRHASIVDDDPRLAVVLEVSDMYAHGLVRWRGYASFATWVNAQSSQAPCLRPPRPPPRPMHDGAPSSDRIPTVGRGSSHPA